MSSEDLFQKAKDAFKESVGYIGIGCLAIVSPLFGLYLSCAGERNNSNGALAFIGSILLYPFLCTFGLISLGCGLLYVIGGLGFGILGVGSKIIETLCSCRANHAIPHYRNEERRRLTPILARQNSDVLNPQRTTTAQLAVALPPSSAAPSQPYKASILPASAPPRPQEEIKNPLQECYDRYFPKNGLIKHSLKAPLSLEQIRKIQQELTDDFSRSLFDTALEDTVSLETMRIPVILPHNGRAYDLYSLSQLPVIKTENEIEYRKIPEPADASLFKMDELVPFYSAGMVLQFLSEDIEYGSKIAIPDLTLQTAVSALENKPIQLKFSDVLTSQEAKQLSTLSNNLLPRQQKIFDTLCRDPMTGYVIQNPVVLPDGIYELRTILTYCNNPQNKQGDTWRCPANPDLLFTEKQIVRCYTMVHVLNCVKQKMLQEKIEKITVDTTLNMRRFA